MGKELAVATLAAVMLATVQAPAIASPIVTPSRQRSIADLGNCAPYTPLQPHQGGYESAVVGTSRGVVSRVYTKNYDLCNNPIMGDSASTAYVMLTREFDQGTYGRWYQIGHVKLPGSTCPVW